MIIATDSEKVFHKKIQHTFTIKILKRVGLEGTNSNTIKATNDKPAANITPNGKNFKQSL